MPDFRCEGPIKSRPEYEWGTPNSVRSHTASCLSGNKVTITLRSASRMTAAAAPFPCNVYEIRTTPALFRATSPDTTVHVSAACEITPPYSQYDATNGTSRLAATVARRAPNSTLSLLLLL